MSDVFDPELRARQEAVAALARAQRETTVSFGGGIKIAGPDAVLMAQAWANQGTRVVVEGYEDSDGFHPGLPPWWPTGPGGIVAQAPSAADVDADLERLDAEHRAARDRERAILSGRVAPS